MTTLITAAKETTVSNTLYVEIKRVRLKIERILVLDLPSDMQFVLYPSHSGVDSLKPLITGRLKAPY